MRKYLIALTVALMVCLLGVSASAEEGGVGEAVKEKEVILATYNERISEMDRDELSTKTQIDIMTKVFEDAGWNVTRETPEMARLSDIDPRVLELAYSDIDAAGADKRDDIIDAREIVMENSSWINDIQSSDFVLYTTDLVKREIKFSPLFSEMFPGWDPPRPKAAEEAKRNIASAMEAIKRGTVVPRQIVHYFDDPDY